MAMNTSVFAWLERDYREYFIFNNPILLMMTAQGRSQDFISKWAQPSGSK